MLNVWRNNNEQNVSEDVPFPLLLSSYSSSQEYGFTEKVFRKEDVIFQANLSPGSSNIIN